MIRPQVSKVLELQLDLFIYLFIFVRVGYFFHEVTSCEALFVSSLVCGFISQQTAFCSRTV